MCSLASFQDGLNVDLKKMLGMTGCLIHELLGVDALYPTGGLGGAAPPTIIAALAVQGSSTKKAARAGEVKMFTEGPPLFFRYLRIQR